VPSNGNESPPEAINWHPTAIVIQGGGNRLQHEAEPFDEEAATIGLLAPPLDGGARDAAQDATHDEDIGGGAAVGLHIRREAAVVGLEDVAHPEGPHAVDPPYLPAALLDDGRARRLLVGLEHGLVNPTIGEHARHGNLWWFSRRELPVHIASARVLCNTTGRSRFPEGIARARSVR